MSVLAAVSPKPRRGQQRRRIAWVRLIIPLWAGLLLCVAATAAKARDPAAAALEASRASPPWMRAFLYRMPKGGDLHNHMTGAAYAEATIKAAAAAGHCVDPATVKSVPPPCAPPLRPSPAPLGGAGPHRAC